MDMKSTEPVSSSSIKSGQPTKAEKKAEARRIAALKNPVRVELIKTHRSMQAGTRGIFIEKNPANGTFGQQVPKRMKEIKLRNIYQYMTWHYDFQVLYLNVIENPMLGLFNPIHLICEDVNKDACVVSIHEIPHNNAMKGLLCPGRQLAVMHPFWRIAFDGRVGIRVDEPEDVVILGMKNTICRYCSKENASKKCSRCKEAYYCNRECQQADWKELQHKLVCEKK